eukprot:scaffold29564_cov60-Phaeocystis_antarctica.AAC.3
MRPPTSAASSARTSAGDLAGDRISMGGRPASSGGGAPAAPTPAQAASAAPAPPTPALVPSAPPAPPVLVPSPPALHEK